MLRDSLIIWGRALLRRWNYFMQMKRNRLVSKFASSVLMNLDIINAVEGAKTSARFEKANLLKVPFVKTPEKLLRLALSKAPSDGLLLEFGTYKGNSINALAKLRPTSTFYGFDSFQGLPEGWTAGTREGGLTTHGRIPPVRKNVELIAGFFADTLPKFLERHPNAPVAFVHVDCDLYSSTLTVLESLRPRLRVGSVLVFDEFYNYADWMEGEYKAWTEFCEKYSIGFRYIVYVRIDTQVGVEVTSLP
jgi:predicted O-methyltransferase YrrM